MPPTIRLELFPATLPPSISFYTKILNFTLLRHEPNITRSDESTSTTDPTSTNHEYGYAHLHRDTIQLGLSTKPPTEYPHLARSVSSRAQFRRWPVGVEIVMEVDDVWAERERIVNEGWTLESEMVRQEWGLWDFRIVDPDGYYWRISERGGVDGKGSEDGGKKGEAYGGEGRAKGVER